MGSGPSNQAGSQFDTDFGAYNQVSYSLQGGSAIPIQPTAPLSNGDLQYLFAKWNGIQGGNSTGYQLNLPWYKRAAGTTGAACRAALQPVTNAWVAAGRSIGNTNFSSITHTQMQAIQQECTGLDPNAMFAVAGVSAVVLGLIAIRIAYA
jgi:hypothetical protein